LFKSASHVIMKSLEIIMPEVRLSD
jgi:hypothetical protein